MLPLEKKPFIKIFLTVVLLWKVRKSVVKLISLAIKMIIILIILKNCQLKTVSQKKWWKTDSVF